MAKKTPFSKTDYFQLLDKKLTPPPTPDPRKVLDKVLKTIRVPRVG